MQTENQLAQNNIDIQKIKNKILDIYKEEEQKSVNS